jgi:hypothetical protein
VFSVGYGDGPELINGGTLNDLPCFNGRIFDAAAQGADARSLRFAYRTIT